MGDPTRYRPDCSVDNVIAELSLINFPLAQAIEPLTASGSYHQLFRLTFSDANYLGIIKKSGLKHTSTAKSNDIIKRSLVLRIAGSHVPTIKIVNEAAILTEVSKHTAIPVPQVVHFDNTTKNAFHHEYMITTFLPGQDGSEIYPSLTQDQLSHILDQLVIVCLDLYRLQFSHIGGLKLDINTQTNTFPQTLSETPTIPGPPIMETMWQLPDIEQHFNNNNNILPNTSMSLLTSLNAISPTGYITYSSWLASQLQSQINTIILHPSLSWVSDSDPDLKALHTFLNQLENNTTLQEKLNSVPLKLAHRDLHFGNMLVCPELEPTSNETKANLSPSEQIQYKITGILDWEFSGILPFPLWRHSFLWDGQRAPPSNYTGSASEFATESRKTRNMLYEQWKRRVAEIGGDEGRDMLRDMEWQCAEQEKAWDVVNLLRCVVEVCPRNVQLDDASRWWKEVVRSLEGFGVFVGGGEGE